MSSAQSPTSAAKSPREPKTPGSLKSPMSRPSGRTEGVVPADFTPTQPQDDKIVETPPRTKSTKSFKGVPARKRLLAAALVDPYLSGSGPISLYSGHSAYSGYPAATFYSGGTAPGVAHPPGYGSGHYAPHLSGFSGPPPGEHTFYSGGTAPGAARPPTGYVYSGPSNVWHAPPHAASAHLSRGNDIVTQIPGFLYESLKACPWGYQSLSKWTHRALAEGWTLAEGWRQLPADVEGLADRDMLISAQEWCEATDNLLAAIATVSPETANLFSMHFRAIKDRLTPSWWPLLRTLRIRLAHTGSAGELVQFDNELFSEILLEEHHAALTPLPDDESSGEDSAPVMIAEEGQAEELADFLEKIRPGLGEYAGPFVDAGVLTKEDLSEVVKLDGAFDSVVDHLAGVTIKDRAVLKSLGPIFKEADEKKV